VKGYIYLITNLVNGKKYVGYTTRTVKKRWKEHMTMAGRGSRFFIHNAIRKWGPARFVVETLETVVGTREDIQAAEVRQITAHGCQAPAGYNLSRGGEGTLDFSVDALERIAAAQRGRTRSEDFRRHVSLAQKGVPKPEGFGAKVSEALKGKSRPWQQGRPMPEEVRLKVSASHVGQPMPESVRKALLASHEGVPMPAEWRHNISAAHMGKTMPEAVRLKISATKMGHPVSEETRRKISAAMKRRSNPDA
jgi:group I intron endonuclease